MIIVVKIKRFGILVPRCAACDYNRVGCGASAAVRRLGSVLGTGGVVVENVFFKQVPQFGALGSLGIRCGVATFAVRRLCAVFGTGSVVIVNVICKIVSAAADIRYRIFMPANSARGGACSVRSARCVAVGYVNAVSVPCASRIRDGVANFAPLALCRLGSVLGASKIAVRNVSDKAVPKRAAPVGQGFRLFAKLALRRFCAVVKAGCVAVGNVIYIVVGVGSFGRVVGLFY